MIFLVHQHNRRFIFLQHQHGCRDVMCKLSQIDYQLRTPRTENLSS